LKTALLKEVDFDEGRKKKTRFLFCISLQNLNGLFLLSVFSVYSVVKNPCRQCVQWLKIYRSGLVVSFEIRYSPVHLFCGSHVLGFS